MDRINPDKLREYLPNDVLNILSYLTGPHIQTLLSNKHRDSYFRKYMICVNYRDMPGNIEPFIDFINRYKLHIKKYPGFIKRPSHFDKIRNSVIIVEVLGIYRLSYITEFYPNIQKILGNTCLTLDNLDTIKRLGRDMILTMGIDQIPFYKKMNLSNMIDLTREYDADKSIISGIEDRLYKAYQEITTEDICYPNLQSIVIDCPISYFMGKNLKLPNLRAVYPTNLLDIPDQIAIREKYGDVGIYWDYVQ